MEANKNQSIMRQQSSINFEHMRSDNPYNKGESTGGGGEDGATAATESNATMQRQAPTVCPSRNTGRPRHPAISIRGEAAGTATSRHGGTERESTNCRSTHLSHRTHFPSFLPITLYPCTLLKAAARTEKGGKRETPRVSHTHVVRREENYRESGRRPCSTVLAKMESAVRVETAASMSMVGGGGLVRGEIERD